MPIRARNLGKTFRQRGRDTTAYAGLDFEIAAGEFVCILGPSGCGKTSLLRTLAGLEVPSTGELEIAASDTFVAPNGPADPPQIGMIFQQHGLFAWMTVYHNIRFLLESGGKSAANVVDIDARVAQVLVDVGLTEFADYYPHQLSGGMCQRVSIARSFAREPDILLMDEPFVFLDYQTRLRLQALLLNLWQRQRSTVVFVTHDIEEAVLLADRILLMSAHPGRIEREIVVDLPRPRQLLETCQLPRFREWVTEIRARLCADVALPDVQAPQ